MYIFMSIILVALGLTYDDFRPCYVVAICYIAQELRNLVNWLTDKIRLSKVEDE